MSETAYLSDLLREIEALPKPAGATDAHYQTILDRVLDHFACTAGTIHGLGQQPQMLHLRARRNIPDGLLSRIQKIPIGKGLAGLAAERRQPVQVCNLQTDDSGAARPAAKETGMEGCIAVPILAGDQLLGVLGIAKPTAYEFSETEIALLIKITSVIGKFLISNQNDSELNS
jgi:signal transduction protein with GAF and PtsI domain